MSELEKLLRELFVDYNVYKRASTVTSFDTMMLTVRDLVDHYEREIYDGPAE